MNMDEMPRQIGPYRLERELGRGFSSIVYQCWDSQHQRLVALKALTFAPSLSEDRRADLTRRFAREGKAISALSHPNIVAILDSGQSSDGRQFIAMEHLQGATLRERLLRAERLSITQAAAIAIRIADALHYAHSRGIIHRDVKPDNVFLAEGPDKTPVPKLMDFGIAHLLADQALTQDGTIVGSPAYMSPEQINGSALDARTDVFSLAVMLAEMITGHKPFEADTIPAVMQRILHHAPELRLVPSRALQRVLAKALAKNSQARYADAAAFAAALRRAVPQADPAPSVATQIMEAGPGPIRRAPARRLLAPAAVSLGAMLLTLLALLPFFKPGPALPAVSRPASQRHWIAAVWHPAARRMGLPGRRAEATPVRLFLSYYTPPLAVSDQPHPLRAAISPAPPAAPRPPAAPLPPAAPAVFRPAVMRAVITRSLPQTAPQPVVRVAGTQQELTRATRTAPSAIPLTEPKPDSGPQPDSDPQPPSSREASVLDCSPRALHRTMPLLPADAPAEIAGTDVRLRVSVNADGDVSAVTVLESSGNPYLDQIAMDTVGHWEYDPAIQGGQSVAAAVTEQVYFVAR